MELLIRSTSNFVNMQFSEKQALQLTCLSNSDFGSVLSSRDGSSFVLGRVFGELF